jgi:hypothetical protein
VGTTTRTGTGTISTIRGGGGGSTAVVTAVAVGGGSVRRRTEGSRLIRGDAIGMGGCPTILFCFHREWGRTLGGTGLRRIIGRTITTTRIRGDRPGRG